MPKKPKNILVFPIHRDRNCIFRFYMREYKVGVCLAHRFNGTGDDCVGMDHKKCYLKAYDEIVIIDGRDKSRLKKET